MSNLSISSSIESSINEPFTEEQEMMLYASIRMNLQAIQRSMHNINLRLKNIQENMHVTEALMDAIETNTPASQTLISMSD